MKIHISVCLTTILFVFPLFAQAQNSAMEWYDKGLATHNASLQIEYFTVAIQLNPKFTDAYLARASVKSDLGDYEAAIVDFDRAIKADVNNVIAYYNRATCHFTLRRYAEAIQDFDRAISLKSDHAYALAGKGCALVMQGKFEAALKSLDQALWINSDIQSANNCKIEALKKLNRTKPINQVKSEPLIVNAPNTAARAPRAVETSGHSTITIANSAQKASGNYQLTQATSLREGSHHTTGVILRFSAGDEVEVLEKTDRWWWKVRFNGQVGYAKSALLKKVN